MSLIIFLKQKMSKSQGFVSAQGLQQLKDYKYKSGKYTWLDNKMNPFWQWSVSLLPLWVAPNLVTFVGWLFVIASYANMLVYDYTFEENIPRHCFFFASFCIFIYSTLDAIDGKQARRTKSSSPLGQLFDHGCDSFSISFFVLAICQAAKLETNSVFLIFTAAQTVFWTSNWMEYHTGVLQTNVGQFGVTQAEYACALIHFITGVFGQDCWQITLQMLVPQSSQQMFGTWFLALKLGSIVAYFFGTLLFLMVLYSVIATMIEQGTKLQTLGEFFTLILILIMQYIWLNLQIYQQYNGIILVNFGIIQSLIICKMIICSVTHMKLQYFHSQIIPFLIGTIIMMGLDIKHNIQGLQLFFWALFAINLGMTLKFLYSTINQITGFLGIKCFSLQKKVEDKKEN